MLTDSALLAALKERLPAAKTLLERVSGKWSYEDMLYRFYHQSFKVYYAQSLTEEIVRFFESLAPGTQLNGWFRAIVRNGTGKTFDISYSNDNWLVETRPIVEAFLHAKYMLEMVVKSGSELDEAVQILPSSWASVLYLYNIR